MGLLRIDVGSAIHWSLLYASSNETSGFYGSAYNKSNHAELAG